MQHGPDRAWRPANRTTQDLRGLGRGKKKRPGGRFSKQGAGYVGSGSSQQLLNAQARLRFRAAAPFVEFALGNARRTAVQAGQGVG